jgi:YVTN family beta-propeller protein
MNKCQPAWSRSEDVLMIRTSWRHYLAAAVAALTCCGTAVTVGPAALAAAAGQPGAGKLGPDLIVNPGAQSGAYSVRGWDAVTIPGWQVVTGLPTVVRYGTPRFPSATGRPPELRSGQLFAGGAGGTARLRQVVALRSAAGTVPTAGTAFRLSAWLGGDKHSRASVAVTFRSAAGRVLGRAAVGPHGGTTSAVVISPFARSGVIPAGSASATIELTLATSLTNVDGPYAPYVGYDRAVADNVQFSVAAPVRRAVLTAPAAHVPRYRHVFLFYFENEDYTDVIGNTRQAPFINSLLPHASVLADFFAEEHPSDGNYLALAGGSTFGIPLDDPLEENSQYTIRAPNIGNLIDTAHETWKAYLQSADGPCDDTVHGYYWDDDMPMTYFADVRERPAYCSQHLVPLQSLQTDLASAATTPNFAWVSPNDCTDMEGCGIRSGDDFLKAELGQIMRSPAWRHQRSLAIITFDEDATDNQHPAQRVPTIVIGSAGVRPGYVSRVRYTHYSLLRTIEAVLGLGTLTPNDRYAQPVNDVFRQGEADVWTQSAAVPAVVSRVRASQVPAGASVPAAGHGPADQTAFVVNSASNSVTPVNLVTSRAGKPVPVGGNPQAIALSPDGGTAYVVNSGSGTVTPINTATRRAGPAIRVGADPQAIAITPDGKTALVTDSGSDTVTPISLATGRPGPPIRVGAGPEAIAITPDGRTAYVLDWGGGSVTPVRIASGRAGPPVRVGSYPFAVSVAPDGRVAYVASYGSDTVTAIDAVTGRKAGPPVSAGQAPDALAVTPDSRAVYAVGGDSDTVTEISAATGGAGQPVPVGYSPTAVAISRSGRWVLVANTISGTVTPVGVATGRAASPISVGAYSYPTAIALAASGPLAVVVDTYSGQVTLINTSTLKSAGTVTVGNYPVAAVIAP